MFEVSCLTLLQYCMEIGKYWGLNIICGNMNFLSFEQLKTSLATLDTNHTDIAVFYNTVVVLNNFVIFFFCIRMVSI